MRPDRTYSKKAPRYLEDITYSIAPGMLEKKDELFESSRFLGLYDEQQVMRILDKVGIVGILYKRGYRNLIISISNHDNYTSRLYVNFDTVSKETRLIELIVREGVFRPKENFVDGFDFSRGMSMMLIEWLALQDPGAAFTKSRPRLPGQLYPGLGGLKNIQDMLYLFGKSMGKDAIIDIPEFYHAAVIYSRMYSFFSPLDAGQIHSMIRDLSDRPLADVSFAITCDCLVDARTGEKTQWLPSEQVYPISGKLKHYVRNKQYHAIVEQTMNSLAYSLDWERYGQLKDQGVPDEI